MAEKRDGAPSFPGFEPPSANFTPAPNQFFDRILGHYPLCVVTVVGILMRETLGWHDKVTGERRIEAELPLPAFIRPNLSKNAARQGLREAIAAGFVVETAARTNRDGTRYALRWERPDQMREAITRQRRAVGDDRPLSDVLTCSESDSESDIDSDADAEGAEGAENESKASSGGPKSGGPKSGPPKSGGPKSTPPTNKEKTPEKKHVSVKKARETFNVPGGEIDQENTEWEDNWEVAAEAATLQPATSAGKLSALRAVVMITGDAKSAGRFVQLFGLCDENGELSAWDEAMAATGKAKASGRLRGPAGAYFNGALGKILHKRGVYVPTGSADDRARLQSEILASLGLGPEDGPRNGSQNDSQNAPGKGQAAL